MPSRTHARPEIVPELSDLLPAERAGAAELASAQLRRLYDTFAHEQRFATRLARATLQNYRTSFELLVALMPTLDLKQLSARTMTEFFRRLDERTRRLGSRERRGVTTSTIASHRSRLGRFFSWLKANGHLAQNPFQMMPYPRVQYEKRQYLGRADIVRIFASLALGAGHSQFLRRRDLALFAILLYTGMRRGELLGLRLTDVDLTRLELHVRADTSKSRHARTLPLNSALARALEDYIEERRRLSLGTPALFVGRDGKPLTFNGLKHLTDRVGRQSGLRFHLHQFRHTFAVNFLHRGGDVAQLRQLLGHSDIRMTSAYLRGLPTAGMKEHIEGMTLDTMV